MLEELLQVYLDDTRTRTQFSLTGNHRREWRIEGVEVNSNSGNSNVNVYLPEDRINHVPGTWALFGKEREEEMRAILFVYPREGVLVRRYVDEFLMGSHRRDRDMGKGEGESEGVQLIIWLGPKADWEDTGFGAFDDREGFEILQMRDGVGLTEYEMLAVLRLKKV